jgi:ubiquinone/menaquinone biosynthesis C-methylase UbiE
MIQNYKSQIPCLREGRLRAEALRWRRPASAKAGAWNLVLNLNTDHRTVFFEKIAPFLRKAVEILAPKKGERILDLCSGTGRAASWIAQAVGKDGEVIGMDVAKRMVEVAMDRYGKSGKVTFLQKDVIEPWQYRDHFDGIFISFSLHELHEEGRWEILEQTYQALREGGRMVIADFNPHVLGRSKICLLIFFKIFERENLNFLSFDQNENLRRVGFTRVNTYAALASFFQITLAIKGADQKI